MNKINIVFITDNNYFRYMLVAISSILNNTKEMVDIYIIVCGLFDENEYVTHLDILKKNYSNFSFDIIVADKNMEYLRFSSKAHVSQAAFMKIYLPNIFPELTRIIYLDSDLILLRDIKDLWDILEKNEDEILISAWNPDYKDDNIFMNIPSDSETFNSGVMLMNLELMRKKNTVKELENFLLEKNHLTRLNDQAAYNAVFYNQWVHLPIVWNFQYKFFVESNKKIGITREEFEDVIRKIGIIHFTTGSKPWQFRNCHPYKETFRQYYNDLFGDLNYEDYSLENILKKIKELCILKIVKFKNLFNFE